MELIFKLFVISVLAEVRTGKYALSHSLLFSGSILVRNLYCQKGSTIGRKLQNYNTSFSISLESICSALLHNPGCTGEV